MELDRLLMVDSIKGYKAKSVRHLLFRSSSYGHYRRTSHTSVSRLRMIVMSSFTLLVVFETNHSDSYGSPFLPE